MKIAIFHMQVIDLLSVRLCYFKGKARDRPMKKIEFKKKKKKEEDNDEEIDEVPATVFMKVLRWRILKSVPKFMNRYKVTVGNYANVLL